MTFEFFYGTHLSMTWMIAPSGGRAGLQLFTMPT